MRDEKLTVHSVAQEISNKMPGLMQDGVCNREQVVAGLIQPLLDQEREQEQEQEGQEGQDAIYMFAFIGFFCVALAMLAGCVFGVMDLIK